MRKMMLAATLLAATPGPFALWAADPLPPEEAALKAHVAFLASDALRGREAGTPDYDVAAEYVAAEMMKAGLEPAGPNGSWFQQVPMMVSRPAAQPTMALSVAGRTVPLVFNTDWTLRRTTGVERLDISGPVVFAGYGVVDPATGRDDYRGLDVRGKIVAMFQSGPKGGNSEVAAHLGNRVDRAKLARARGATAVLMIESSQIHARLPFARQAQDWDARAVTWTGADGRPRDEGAPGIGIVGYAGAAKLFAGSRIRWADVLAADTAGRAVPTGPLAASVTTSQRYTVERLRSANVVGRLPGSDARLDAEHIVLSGHLDHVGVTRPVEGDGINNGAMDNAIGIAAMLEVARAFQKSGERPKRSLLFAAVTAEEKGLVGSDYLASNPLASARTVVANVNLDMPLLTYKFTDLTAYGADRSTIGPVAAAAARAEGYTLAPDPSPEEAIFTRSDHYSWVRQGVPSVFLVTGYGGPGRAAWERFLKNHYHRPSDEIGLPIDWTAARGFVRVNYGIARALANATDRPRWVRGDYFGTAFRGPMAK